MARKPVHIERSGGKGPRQRIWEQVRRTRTNITYAALSRATKIEMLPVSEYVRALSRAGYVKCMTPSDAPVGTEKVWTLVRDAGINAPRLKEDGTPVLQGRANQNMWRSMQIVGEFNARELARHASTDEFPVAEGTAKKYVIALHRAGYLKVVVPARHPSGKLAAQPARYILLRARITGPRPPMIQRTKCVYDPNSDKIVWQEEPDRDAC